MAIKADKVWMDGELVDFDKAQVHVLTHSLHYGLGAFEGIRCYERADGRGAIFRLREHARRLVESCHIATMPLPWTVDQVMDACIETVRANGFTDCYIRPLAFLGHGEMGLAAMSNKVRLSVIAWPWGSYLGDEGIKHGIDAKISSFSRHHINSAMAKGKITGQYVNSILAKREAMADGYKEAIMLDTNGFVSEGTGENIFAVYDVVVYTTPFHEAILGGITRDTVMKLATERGHKIVESRMTRDFLYVCQEVFAVGTAAEVTPIRAIDRRQIGTGEPGPVTREVQEAYFDLVKGSSTAHPEWLTYVN
jgi:branched-chain amino acid aminotransferase